MCKISVIVPVYNVRDYLSKCIESLINQTVIDMMDIILVDDGATDGSAEICDEYAKKHAFIHTVHKPNGGLSDARNAGLDFAYSNLNPDYIAFVDSDDFIHPQTYEIALDMIGKSGADISAFYYEFVGDEQVAFNHYSYNDYKDYEVLNCSDILDRLPYFSRTVSLVSACMKLYKAEILRDLRFEKGFTEEDSLILPYILKNTKTIARTHLPLYFWYIREDSITHRPFNKNTLSMIEVSYRQALFFRENNLDFNYSHFAKQFMNRCIYYKMRCLENRKVLPYFKPYRKKYIKHFFEFFFKAEFFKAEAIMHLLFFLNIPLYKKLYITINPEYPEN